MYSFAQRRDVRVVDEPLYGHYLRVSGADHPGRQKVMGAMNCDGAAVMGDLLLQQVHEQPRVLFIKHMAHHLHSLDLSFLKETRNVFLVRDPREMLPSLTIQLPEATLSDTGLRRQWELFKELADQGRNPAILDARELLLNPQGVLRQLCTHLDLEFDPGMLTWKAGARAEDGVWAPHWYHAVHQSTGFSAYQAKTEFPEHLQSLLNECRPWYEKLYAYSLRADAAGELV
jgi:hypothetical protein